MGVFPFAATYSLRGWDWEWISSAMAIRNQALAATSCLAPIVASIGVMRYLQSPNSACVMLSLPLKRQKLLNSSLLSGILMTWLPLVANSALFFALTPEYTSEYYFFMDRWNALFSAGSVFSCLMAAMTISFLVLSILAFAGATTGTTPMHILAGAALC
jgi:hypothetical protein